MKEKPKWIKAGCFCPGCGGEATWVRNDDGDYYTGPPYVCLGCDSRGYMWSADKPERGFMDEEIAEVRRCAIAAGEESS